MLANNGNWGASKYISEWSLQLIWQVCGILLGPKLQYVKTVWHVESNFSTQHNLPLFLEMKRISKAMRYDSL